MLQFGNKEFRNLDEQVEKNAQDIQDFKDGNQTIAEFGITVVGILATAAELPAQGENFGDAYILMAQAIAGSPNWSEEPALNKCTFFLVVDKLQRAKSVDPACAERAQELISTYSRYYPATKDLFMLGIKAGDRVTIGGWIGESTTVR